MHNNFKPLLFTTTVRNPERIKLFLSILFEFDNMILTNDLIKDICLKIFIKRLYKPTKANSSIIRKWQEQEDLTKDDALFLYDNNIQNHKEAGFDKGWTSRFDTWYKICKEFGLVDYSMNNKIIFTEIGKFLISYNQFAEQIVFTSIFCKYQRNNPFRNVDNQNKPLILLLKTI